MLQVSIAMTMRACLLMVERGGIRCSLRKLVASHACSMTSLTCVAQVTESAKGLGCEQVQGAATTSGVTRLVWL